MVRKRAKMGQTEGDKGQEGDGDRQRETGRERERFGTDIERERDTQRAVSYTHLTLPTMAVV